MHNIFGTSVGFRWFRIGRSQNGVWWIRIRLPFGIVISRRLGKRKANPSSNHNTSTNNNIPGKLNSVSNSSVKSNLTKNQVLLDELKKTKKSN